MNAPEFADWWAITRTIAQYGRSADARRFDDMVSLFAVDGRMLMFRARSEDPAESPAGHGELRRAFEALEQFDVTSHVLAPSEVVVHGDTAWATTYCMSHHIRVTDQGKVRFTLADRYEDTLVRSGAHWLFLERRKYTDWSETVASARSGAKGDA